MMLQQESQRKQALMQRDIDELTRQLEAARERLDEAKRAKEEK